MMRHSRNQAQTARSQRHERLRRQHRLTRGLRYVRTGALGLLFGGMLVAFALVLGLPGYSASNGNDTSAVGARPVSSGGWVHLRSTSPADLLAAVRSTPLYQEVANSSQARLGQALRSGTLGTPILVHAYRPTP